MKEKLMVLVGMSMMVFATVGSAEALSDMTVSVDFNVLNAAKITQSMAKENACVQSVIQNGEIVLMTQIDSTHPWCTATVAAFPSSGEGVLSTTTIDVHGNLITFGKLEVAGLGVIMSCESHLGDFDVSDTALTLKGVIDFSPGN
jgi:hypothetical protein